VDATGIHVAKVLGQPALLTPWPRLKIYPMARRRCGIWRNRPSDRSARNDRDHQYRGRDAVRLIPPGCELSTMYVAAVATQAANAREARA
jgi:hypothetical protein